LIYVQELDVVTILMNTFVTVCRLAFRPTNRTRALTTRDIHSTHQPLFTIVFFTATGTEVFGITKLVVLNRGSDSVSDTKVTQLFKQTRHWSRRGISFVPLLKPDVQDSQLHLLPSPTLKKLRRWLRGDV
jgi:hypothetical protein